MTIPSSSQKVSSGYKIDWEQLYPGSSPTYPLHSFLARLQPSQYSSAEFVIEGLAKKDAKYLTVQDPDVFDFSPLHIAAIKGNDIAIRTLVKIIDVEQLSKAINAQDRLGWTTVHHARLNSLETYHFLLKNGGDILAKSFGNATIAHLEEAISSKTTSQSLNSLLFEVSGSLKALSEEEIKTLTKMERYTDSNCYSSESLGLLWQDFSENPHNYEGRVAKEAHEKWVARPTKLVVGPCPQLAQRGVDTWELRAGEQLQKGDPIIPYSGMMTCTAIPDFFSDLFNPTYMSEIDYLLGHVDAKLHGNAARFANCGFPNTLVLNFPGPLGKTYMLLALEDIKEGTPLIWDYRISYTGLKFGRYAALNFDAMRAHFSKGFDALYQEIEGFARTKIKNPRNPENQEILGFHHLLCKFLYPLHTPAALLDLHFRKIVPCNKWLTLFDTQPDWFQDQYFSNGQLFFCQYSVIARIEEFETSLAKSKRKLAPTEKKVKEWVLNSIGSRNIMDILKGLSFLTGQFSNKSKSKIPIETLMTEMEKGLVDYDWLKDDKAPLAVQQRRLDLLKYWSRFSRQDAIELLNRQIQTLSPKRDFTQNLKWVLEQILKTRFV